MTSEPARIRPYQPDDLDEVYRICLQTADNGQDATSLFRDPRLPGHVYAAPHAIALTEGCEQLWARRDARRLWQLDLLLDRSGDEWVFKRDARVRLPWPRAVHVVDGIPYLRPEIALLHKAHLDRPKDRSDLAAAELGAENRAWLVHTLDMLGHHSWAQLAHQRPGQTGQLRQVATRGADAG